MWRAVLAMAAAGTMLVLLSGCGAVADSAEESIDLRPAAGSAQTTLAEVKDVAYDDVAIAGATETEASHIRTALNGIPQGSIQSVQIGSPPDPWQGLRQFAKVRWATVEVIAPDMSSFQAAVSMWRGWVLVTALGEAQRRSGQTPIAGITLTVRLPDGTVRTDGSTLAEWSTTEPTVPALQSVASEVTKAAKTAGLTVRSISLLQTGAGAAEIVLEAPNASALTADGWEKLTPLFESSAAYPARLIAIVAADGAPLVASGLSSSMGMGLGWKRPDLNVVMTPSGLGSLERSNP